MKNFIKISCICCLFFANIQHKQFDRNVDVKTKIIYNVITDYSKREKTKKGHTYFVTENKSSDLLYCFSISESKGERIRVRDSIGATSQFFPSGYREINDNLFIWTDSTKVITDELILNMKKYNAIDSSYYKLEKGIIGEDELPEISTDESKTAVFYFICKKSIDKFKKIKTRLILPVEKYPNVKCH